MILAFSTHHITVTICIKSISATNSTNVVPMQKKNDIVFENIGDAQSEKQNKNLIECGFFHQEPVA